MNEADAEALFAQLAPELDAWTLAVRAEQPTLPEPAVLDQALRHALARLRREVSQETYVYLRWRAEQAHAAASATVAASAAARQARADARDAETHANAAGGACAFRATDGGTWSVHEVAVGAMPWAHGPRCLVFQSETAIRRVWHYPARWRELPAAALEALSWQT